MLTDVPVLDFQDFYNEKKQKSFIKSFGEAINQLGFVRLINHGVDQDLVDEAYKISKEFFLKLDKETKEKYHCSKSGGNRGYSHFGQEHAKDNSNPDLKEFFHIGRELAKDHKFYETYGANLFPEELPEFKEIHLKLFKNYDKLSQALLQCIALYCGLDKDYFVSMTNEGNSITRVIYYPPLKSDDHLVKSGSIRAAAHEDINLLTILPSATESGLEILRKYDKKWIPVNDKRGEVVIDTGDMFARLSNNYFPAITHRVVNPPLEEGKEAPERMSLPFFCHCNPDAILDPKVFAKALKLDETNLLEPITANEFLIKRLKEIGLMK